MAVVVFLTLCCYSNSQDNCQTTDDNGGVFVGFTALTPEQLKKEIRTSTEESVSELVGSLIRGREREETCFEAIEDLNYTINATVATIKELNQKLEQSIIINITQTVERLVKSALAEILTNITLKIPEAVTQPITMPTTESKTSTAPTEVEPTIQEPTTPPALGTRLNPATSCKQIFESITNPPSDFYWVTDGSGGQQANPGNTIQVYCDMERTCGGLKGGWMQVANIDMTDSTQTCPTGFTEITRAEAPKRICTASSTNSGCFGITFSANGVPYSSVCGRVIGYQEGTPNAFYPYHINTDLTIDDIYVDGLSLTHGSPRQHIWTFVSALDETSNHLSACICSNTGSTESALIPPFVGDDYFCDTGSRDGVAFQFYPEDPLWDGNGCGPLSTCCSLNDPPWFFKQVTENSRDDLELRVCRDSGAANEDNPFEIVELYVR